MNRVNGDVQLMAAGILANMEGKRGIRAWRWYAVFSSTATFTKDVQVVLYRSASRL